MRRTEAHGFHAFDWESDALFLSDLLEAFPEIALGNHLVNTSFDSGLFRPSETELAAGWRITGGMAHSSEIRSLKEIPHDQYDEWLVFDSPVEVRNFETMANFLHFSPVEFEWEEKWDRFWEQVVELQPLHVIGENTRCYVATRDSGLAERLARFDAETRFRARAVRI
jgi:hypothetical protein